MKPRHLSLEPCSIRLRTECSCFIDLVEKSEVGSPGSVRTYSVSVNSGIRALLRPDLLAQQGLDILVDIVCIGQTSACNKMSVLLRLGRCVGMIQTTWGHMSEVGKERNVAFVAKPSEDRGNLKSKPGSSFRRDRGPRPGPIGCLCALRCTMVWRPFRDSTKSTPPSPAPPLPRNIRTLIARR